jgi:RNA polymerase sigma factor (TIGR02999 family)
MHSNRLSRRVARRSGFGSTTRSGRGWTADHDQPVPEHSTPEQAVQPAPRLCAVPAGPRRAGDEEPCANDELFAQVYDELRRLADHYLSGEKPGQTLQPTALVHEAYLRLAGTPNGAWENRAHFFGAAARAIRCILIDRSRARRSARRGEGVDPLSLEDVDVAGGCEPGPDLLDLDAALGRLALLDPHKARVVELRFFGGLSIEETAEVLAVSAATVKRDWLVARAWLHRELRGGTAE